MRSLLLLIILAVCSGNGIACSCGGYDIEEAFNEYEYVFIGAVKSFGFKWPWIDHLNSPVKVNFDVIKSYKQMLDKEFSVFTHPQSSFCGFPFEEGVEYIVFAQVADKNHDKFGFGKVGAPTVDICSPTIGFNGEGALYEKERKKILKYLESNNRTTRRCTRPKTARPFSSGELQR